MSIRVDKLSFTVHLAHLPLTLVGVAGLPRTTARPFKYSVTVENAFFKVSLVFGAVGEGLASISVALVVTPLSSVLGIMSLVELDPTAVSDGFDHRLDLLIDLVDVVNDPWPYGLNFRRRLW